MWFDAHNHGFRVRDGMPRRGIYGNMRTAVERIGPSRERQVNTRFLAMESHYLFEPEFCNPVSGWGGPWSATGPGDRASGHIEKKFRDARHRCGRGCRRPPSLEALSAWLEQRYLNPLGGDPTRS